MSAALFSDEDYMAAAVAFARRGLGETAPNPAVGCLIVKDGVIIGRGATQKGGRPHAETIAIADAGVAKEFIMICDFVCPTRELREVFDADFTVWMDTIPKGRYADTNSIFEKPTEEEYDIRIDEFNSDSWSATIADLIHMLV